MNNYLLIISLSIFLHLAPLTILSGQDTLVATETPAVQKKFMAGGYLKGMPSAGYDNLTDKVLFNNIVHNRLNFRYNHNSRLFMVFEIRNRLLTGNTVKHYHKLISETLKYDDGLVQTNFVPVSNENILWHVNPDRLYVDWRNEKWQVRLGRQRINWGINMISNPNDLFNNFSFFDFDYEERPGADALRVQHYTGNMSRIELAVSPSKNAKESVAGMLWAFNSRGYDFQVITGYFKNRSAIGAGWAGNIKSTGFKGEFTLFNNLNYPDSMNLILSVGFDHMFKCGIYGFAEFLYNGGHSGSADPLKITEPMRTDNPFISKYSTAISFMYPLSPVLSASFAALYMPDIRGGYLMPNIGWSIIKNLDASLVGQYFTFIDKVEQHNINIYVQVKWSF